MLPDARLRAALSKAPLVSFHGFVTRFMYEVYRHAPMPKGAMTVGQRYNPPGVAAIYASFSRACALAEFTQYFKNNMPISAASMVSLDVRLSRVLDITNSEILNLLHSSREELCSMRIPGASHPALSLGTAASAMRIDGIIAPSAVFEDDNLVIYPDAHITPPYTIVRSTRTSTLL